MARFFIERPIFAIVLAILIMLAGGLSILTLPIEQYPQIAPPSVQISTTLPGASAQTMQDTVVQVIEQRMSGLDHLLYMSSVSDDTGQSTTTLTFAPGTDPDIAQVQVQNKVQLATSALPAPVQQSGIRVTKSNSSFLLVAGFVSTDNSMNKFDIANYVVSNLQDPISRIDGVGNFNVFGTQYAIRIWLDPHKLDSFALTPLDVTAAVSNQNVQVSGGQLGGAPAVANQQLTATITEATLLRTPEDFGAILLKVLPDGSQVRLRDVARINLGAESFSVDTQYDGQPASGIAIQLGTGANALATANAVRARIAELSKYFPPGLKVVYPNDSTPFIKISIEEVVKTLFEGIALVFLVMLLFLQNLRATIIPTLAVPVVLLGTLGVMAALGFTINTLSMFGLVLAIGLLVDDAIVVVENVERVMAQEGLPAREATRKAMGQITGALIGVAMVLSAVFVPVAFSSGTVGAIYRQFSLTIVSAMLLSVFVALTLTPALCATILKPPKDGHENKKGFFGWFNRRFESGRDKYVHGVRHVIARSGRWLAIYGAAIVAVGWLFVHLPTSFLPTEDQGFLFVQVQLPPGATMERTGAVLEDVSSYLLKEEARMVDATFIVNGFNNAGRGQSQGQVFVRLKDWSQRTAADLSAKALNSRISQHFSSYKEATIIPVNPPPIQGLGTAAGFDFELEDRGGVGHARLMQALDQLMSLAKQDPELALVRPNGLPDNPTFKVDMDREKASALGVAVTDVDQTFSIAWGSKYVNNFLGTDGRIKRVYVQADAPYRMNPADLDLLYVRNNQSGMVPFSSFAKGTWTYGPTQLQRYNGVPAVEIQGQAAPGRSTGQAMVAMERLMNKLPAGIGYEWTGISLQQQQSGSRAPYFYALSILVVFLSLAALYESWSIPLSVIMVVPLGVLGALGAATWFGMSNDVYFQVGLLTTIGLSAKNAILIVEFARELQARGSTALEAAIEAAHMRMRPIVMTSMAFVLGVLPLALAKGAGSGSQNAIGTGVIGGMLTATFLATFMIPMFYVVVADKLKLSKPASTPALPTAAAVGSLEDIEMTLCRHAAIAASVALVAGCSLQPVYHRPAAPIAAAFPAGEAYKTPASELGAIVLPAAEIGWRNFLADPRLRRLVEIALENNRDLRVAALNVAQVQAQYRVQRAALFPVVSASSGASKSRSSGSLEQGGRPLAAHDYSVGLSAAWEVDFFGRLRSLSDAALQQYLATAYARQAAQILLVSQVADQYLAILASDEQLAVTQKTIETAQASYKIVQLKFDTGTASELDLQLSRTALEQAQANHAAQVRAQAQAENALVLLVGQPLPPDLPPPVKLKDQEVLADIPAGLPSDLLTRRPDILQAEAVLRSENANIGAARAAFFPRITLTGTFGTASSTLGGLLGSGSSAWSFVPSLVAPIFNAGANMANLDIAKVQKDKGIAQYEKAIQTAFREVSDGLAARGTYDDQLAATQRLTDAEQSRLQLAEMRYTTGVDGYLGVLTAQTDLYNAQQALVSSRLNRLSSLVDLYRSLGGGWIQHTGDEPRRVDDPVLAKAPGSGERQ